MTISRLALSVALLLLGTERQFAAQAVPPPQGQPSISSTATAVLVDVVVRDRKGRPVSDLSASDFEVSESGVPQRIDTFTRVSRGRGIGIGVSWRAPDRSVTLTSPSPSDTSGSEAPADDATTALVFDHLSADSLRLAQRATLDYVPITGHSGVRIGVFATGPGIRVVQPYTTDRALVRRAVEAVVPSGSTASEQKAERADDLLSRRRALESQSEALVAGALTGAGPTLATNAAELGRRENELRLLQTELNMIRAFDDLDRDHQGYDTSLALLAVVHSLSSVPGRKTIVFFSEGLPVSPSLSARLDYIIDVANRANVTAYAIDAKGLRARSTLTNTRKELDAFADERLSQVSTGTDRTHQPLSMAFERVEDSLKLDSRTGLARLAQDTGGFLIGESNDLTRAFRQMDEDSQFHYLLTYSPTNTVFDGRFRPIQVRVRGGSYRVFARKGYRAVPRGRSTDTGNFEAPALALLDRSPLPNAFPVHAAGFSFPDPARPGLTPVIVRVGTEAFRFAIDARRSTYSGQACVVVRISSADGQQVQKVSQEYVFSGDARDVEGVKRGELIFYREVDLAPGVYTMETIVFDAAAGVGSARVATLTVPASSSEALGMSSLVLVRRVEDVGDTVSAASVTTAPLYVGRLLLYPNLGEPFRRADTSELPFFFTLYGDLREVHAGAQLYRNGQIVAEAPVPLAAGKGPSYRHQGRIAVNHLPAGTYQLVITAGGAGGNVTRSAFFTLRD